MTMTIRMPWDRDIQQVPPSPTTIKTTLDYALKYVELGWKVLPCHSIKDQQCTCGNAQCTSPGKHPLPKNGVKDATTDTSLITKFFAQWPWANIAIATGAESGIFAVDVDIKPDQGKFGNESLEALEKDNGYFPDTVMAITGSGGQHYLFNYPKSAQVPNSTGRIAPWIDIRGDNGYIIVEPSIHLSLIAYAWEGSCDPVFTGMQVADAPQWLLDRVIKKSDTQINNAGFICNTSEWSVMTDEQRGDFLSALDKCPNELRDHWLEIGMAIHSVDSSIVGFEIWSNWSQTSVKYDAKDQARVWVSFSNSKAVKRTKESVFFMARNHGWMSTGEIAAKKQVDALVSTINNPVITEVTPKEDIVIDCLFPVPILNRIAGLINASSAVYSETATTQAVITLAATVASRRYITPHQECCHLYTGICSGSIGSIGELRYTTKAIRDILHQSGLRRMVREQRLSSTLALYKTLWASPASVYLCDDYSAMLKLVQRQTTGGMEVVLNTLTRIYDEHMIQLDSPEEAGLRNHDDGQPVLQRPGLSMLALMHHSQLATFAKTSELGRGAVEQFLFALCDNEEVRFKEASPLVLPVDMIDHIRLMRGVPGLDQIDHDLTLDSIFNTLPGVMPTLIPVQFAHDLAPYDQLIDNVTDDRRYRMFKSGARKNMRRLMAILASWNDPLRPVADKAIMHFAAQYVAGQLKKLIDMMLVVASDDGKMTVEQQILAVIINQGVEGVKASNLHAYSRLYKALSKDKRQDVLDKMLDDGDIELANIKTGSGQVKKRLVYKKFLIAQ